MAFPTNLEIAAVARAWFRAPGRPRLPVLRARLCALITPPDDARSSVTVAIRVDPGPVYTLVVTLNRWTAAGAPLAVITREWTPDIADRPGFDLLDCADEDKRPLRDLQGGT